MTLLVELYNALLNKKTQQEVLNQYQFDGLSFATQEDIESIKKILYLLTNGSLKDQFLAKMTAEQLKQLGQSMLVFSQLMFLLKYSSESQLRLLSVLDNDTLSRWPLREPDGRPSLVFWNLLHNLQPHVGLLVSKLNKNKFVQLIVDLEDLGRLLGVLTPASQKVLLDSVKKNLDISALPFASKPLVNQWFTVALLALSPELNTSLLSQLGSKRCVSLLNRSRQENCKPLTEKLLSLMVPASWTLKKWFYSSSIMSCKPKKIADEVDEQFTQEELVEMKLTNRRQSKQTQDFFSTINKSSSQQLAVWGNQEDTELERGNHRGKPSP